MPSRNVRKTIRAAQRVAESPTANEHEAAVAAAMARRLAETHHVTAAQLAQDDETQDGLEVWAAVWGPESAAAQARLQDAIAAINAQMQAIQRAGEEGAARTAAILTKHGVRINVVRPRRKKGGV